MKSSLALSLVLAISGCGGTNSPSSPLLQPVQGHWRFDLENTLAVWQSRGVPPEQIAQTRAMNRRFPLHQDMTIDGDLAILSGFPQGEYHFFAVHPHDGRVCGKAWHHEDRHDPGDMSKCYTRLELRDGELHLAVRMQDGGPDLHDPDLSDQPAPIGSPDQCGADVAQEPTWSPWQTYVFVRE